MDRRRGFTFPSIIGILAVLIVLAAFGLPHLVTSRSTPKTTAAAANLRLILTQELLYSSTHPEGAFGTLEELRRAGLLDSGLASGRKDGYTFLVVPRHKVGFSVTAIPDSPEAHGHLTFFGDETGVIRMIDAPGPSARLTTYP